MYGLIFRYFLIILIRVSNRTILNAGPAACAFIFKNVARFFGQFDGEITCFSCNTVDLGVRENFDIWMPADLDQFR